jgi:FKBP-type peptidyl-prolyl cis-trans isomerase
MKRTALLSLLLLACAALLVAQSSTAAPTKVTGKSKSTHSDVEYWDIVVGTGKTAVLGKKVVVHYTGWMTNGKKFDSSVDRMEPYTFTLGAKEVIKGWDEGIVGMKEGGKRQLKVPATAAYGSRGRGPIPPNATLIFDVELLAVR